MGMIFGGLIPFMVLRHQIRKRKEAITYQLPEVLDLLSVSVTAGLSLDGAMQKITESMDGELVDEFRRMQRDVRMGMTRHRAMRLMAERCDVQDLNLFVTSVIRSERLGASMGDTLDPGQNNMRDTAPSGEPEEKLCRHRLRWCSRWYSSSSRLCSSSYCFRPSCPLCRVWASDRGNVSGFLRRIRL